MSPGPFEEWGSVRRAFQTWSIVVPVTLDETFVRDGNYWHAYDQHRSISLASLVVTDGERPVTAVELAAATPRVEGEAVSGIPPDVVGWPVTATAPQPARASRLLQGMLFIEGRALIVTITSDDLDWARETWLSIRTDPAVAGRWRTSAMGGLILRDAVQDHDQAG